MWGDKEKIFFLTEENEREWWCSVLLSFIDGSKTMRRQKMEEALSFLVKFLNSGNFESSQGKNNYFLQVVILKFISIYLLHGELFTNRFTFRLIFHSPLPLFCDFVFFLSFVGILMNKQALWSTCNLFPFLRLPNY